MRLHRSRFVSCLLITAFITTSATPAFALRPPAKKEAAGLEELDEALRSGDPADAATAAGALTTRLAGALGLTPSAPAAYAPAPASSVPAAGLEEDEDDELPPVTEEWGGPLSLTLALDSPTLDSRVVLAGMSSLGDLVWMSFTEIDHAGRPRVAFQVQGVPENVVVVRKGIIEKDLEVHRGSWSFMNDPALLRPIMDRQDFQEMLGRLRSKAHGAKQFDPNRPGGRLVVTFRYGDTQDAEEVILFDTRGDDPAAWRPFAVVKARPEGRWRARLIVRALQHVEIMRESVYRRGRTAPAAGLEEDEDDELPPVTEETVRDDLARHESGLADALSIGDTEGIETYTELIQSDHAKLEELGDAAGLEEARDTERPWQALIGEGKELSIEEANALLKQAAAAEGIGGLSYKPRESSRATWEHLNQTASTDQVRITRAIDAMAVNGRVHAAIRKGVAWIKSPAAGEGLPTAGLEESASPLSFPGVRQIAILGIREGTDGTDRVFPSLYNQSRAGVRKRLFPGMDPDARMPVLMGQAGQGRLSSLEMFFGETERYPTYDLVLVEQGYYALNRERLEEALRRSPSRQAVVVPFDQGKRYGEQELARLVVEAVRTEFSSAPYAVGVRLHGNHVSAALVNGKGKVVRTTALPAARWRDLPDVRRLLGNPPEDRLNDRILELIPVPKQGKAVVQQDLPAARAVADRITEEVVRHVVELVRNTGLPLGGLRRVRIGFAGSVNTETGAAGDPYASANIPGYDHYPLTQEVARGVESALGVKPEVDLLNDAPMGRKGEASPTGTAPGMPDAVFMIWGTGINTDGLDLPETGHGLVGSRREDGLFHYEYRDASQERPALAEGEFEVEQRLGGEVLKARFQQGGYADGAEVTTRAYEQDAGARRLIVDAGSEMGRAIAAGLALRYRQSGFIPRRFVLGAGVAEGLGRGVTDRQRRDLLIGAVQDAAYQELAERFQIPAKPAREIADSIVRTRMTSDERDFAAAGEGLPAAGLEEITPDTDVLELVKPGGLLTSPDGREFLVRRVDGDNNGIEVSPMIISEGTGEQYPADRIETLFRSLVGWRYAPPAAPLQETLRELREDPDQGDEEPDLPLSAEPPGEDLTGLEEEAMLMRVDDILDRIVYDESIRAVRTSGQSPNEALGRENDGVVEDRRIIRHGTLNRLASPLAEDGYVELRVRDGEAVLSAPTDWTLVRVLSVQAAVSAVTYDRRVQTVAHDTSTGVREISRQGEIPPYQAVDAAARQTAGAGETLRVKIKNGRALLLPPSANEDRPLPVGQAQGEIFSVRGGVRRVAFTRDAKHNLLAVATERVVPTDSSKREGEVVTFDWAASARRRWVHFKKSVLAVTFSQTQQGILTVTPEEAVRLNAHWEYAEESLPFALHLPPADQMYPHSLAFSPDRKLLLVTGRELSQARVQNLDIADAKKFEKRLGILVKLTPEWGKPISGAFHPDGKVVALGTSAGTVELWRLPAEPGGRAERLAEARWHGGAVRAALFSPNGRVLATGDSNGNVRLWRWDEPMQELIPLHSFSTAPGQPVHSVSFLPVGIADRGKPGEKVRDADLGSQVIAAAGQDGVVRFWDALQGRELARMGYGREPAPITSISFSPDGTKIAAGHAANDRGNGTLAIWKVPAAVSEFAASLSRPAPTPAAGLEEGSVLGVVGIVGRSPPLVRQLEQLAKSVRPELEGDVVTYIASGNEIWELDEERFVMTLERVGSIGNGAVIVAADASLAAPGDAAVKHVVGLLAAFQVPLRYIAQADRDDVALALAEMEQELEAEEAAAPQPSAGGKPAGLMIKGLRSPTGVTLSPDGRTLFVREFGIFSPDGRALFESGFGTGRVRAFSAADGRPTGLVIENIDGFDDGVALSPDGRTVFVGGGHSGRVRAFSAVDGAPTGLVIENIDGLDNVALSPDGRTVFVSGVSEFGAGRVRAFSAADGTPTGLVIENIDRPHGMALSPDGRTVFVRESLHKQVCAFSVADGTATGLVIGNIGDFDDVALSPDGRTVFVSGGDPGRVRAFSAVDGAPTGLVIENIDRPHGMALSPDGRVVFVVEYGGNRVVAFSTAVTEAGMEEGKQANLDWLDRMSKKASNYRVYDELRKELIESGRDTDNSLRAVIERLVGHPQRQRFQATHGIGLGEENPLEDFFLRSFVLTRAELPQIFARVHQIVANQSAVSPAKAKTVPAQTAKDGEGSTIAVTEAGALKVLGIVGHDPILVNQLGPLAKSVRPELEGDVVTYIASGKEVWDTGFVTTVGGPNAAVIVAGEASLGTENPAVKNVVTRLTAHKVPIRYVAQADRNDVALALAEMEQALELGAGLEEGEEPKLPDRLLRDDELPRELARFLQAIAKTHGEEKIHVFVNARLSGTFTLERPQAPIEDLTADVRMGLSPFGIREGHWAVKYLRKGTLSGWVPPELSAPVPGVSPADRDYYHFALTPADPLRHYAGLEEAWVRKDSVDEALAYVHDLARQGAFRDVRLGESYLYYSPEDPALRKELETWARTQGISFYIRREGSSAVVIAMTSADFARRHVGEIHGFRAAYLTDWIARLGDGWTIQVGRGDSAEGVPASDTQALQAAVARDLAQTGFYSLEFYADKRAILTTSHPAYAGLEEGAASRWMVSPDRGGNRDRFSVDLEKSASSAAFDRAIDLGAEKVTANPASMGFAAQAGELDPYLSQVDPSLRALRGWPLLWWLQRRRLAEELGREEVSIELDPTVVSLFELRLNAQNKLETVTDSGGGFVLKPEFRQIVDKVSLAAGEKLTDEQATRIHDVMVLQWLEQALEIHHLGLAHPGPGGVNNATVKVGNTKGLIPWMGQDGRMVGVDVYHILAVLGISRNFTLGFTEEDADQAIQANQVDAGELERVRGMDLNALDTSERILALIPSMGSLAWRPGVEMNLSPGQGRAYYSHFASRVGVKVNEAPWRDRFESDKHRNWFDIVMMLHVLLTRFNDELPEARAHGVDMIPASLGTKLPGQEKDHYLRLLWGAGRRVTMTAPQSVVEAFNARGLTEEQLAELRARMAQMKRAYAQEVAALKPDDASGRLGAAIGAIADFLTGEDRLGNRTEAGQLVGRTLTFGARDPKAYAQLHGELYPEGDVKFQEPHLNAIRIVNGKASAQAGLEEAPVIGYLPALAGKEAALSRRLLSGQPHAKGDATKILMKGVDAILRGGHPRYDGFDAAFGRLLRLSRGNMQVFADAFLGAQRVYRDKGLSQSEQALLEGVRRLAQDPGAPHNKPPVSYHNPARYVYARLRQKALRGFVKALTYDMDVVRGLAAGRNLADLHAKTQMVRALQGTLGNGRQTVGPYSYELFYDSLVEKDGELYLTLELLLDGELDYHEGVVLELQVVIPAAGMGQRYRSPYPLDLPPAAASGYSIALLDPIHFINTRFPEWGPKTQRDVYESRLRTLKETGGTVKRQYIRPSVRQGSNPRFFEPFFRAYLAGNVPLAYHIVDALASERDYGNQGGVGSVANLASAIVRRGGTGATASWMLEDPAAAGPIAEEERRLVYTYEKDHHRIDSTKSVEGFASELEPFLLAYPENLMTGWPSANLQDETKFINQKARGEALKAGAAIAKTGMIDKGIFGLLQETYNGTPVADGLPSALGMHWLRNRWLHDVVDTLRERGIPLAPFHRWYIEPDYALDGKPHTVEEFAYLTFMSWVSAQAHGHPLGGMVPSTGNVHGASKGNPSLALAGILQYTAQAATLYGEPLPADLLAIARKAPRGYFALAGRAAGHFEDPSLKRGFLAIVESAGERTEAEEKQLGDFALAQLQRIPADVLKTLKGAEQALMKEVEQAQRERRQPRPLEEVAPGVVGKLGAVTAQLDKEINKLPLDRRAGITIHAASGLSAEELSEAREYGVWVANKSTEFQNIITAQLWAVYMMAAGPTRARGILGRMPAAQAAWDAHPLSWEETQRVADSYSRMYDAAAARAIKAAKTDAEKEALRQAASNPVKPFPWFWSEGTGWSMEDPSGFDWSAYEWVPGAHGRYMFSMRDTMTGQGQDNTLLFPNELTWGLPPTVIAMAQAEIERTIHFYHQPSVMNALGGAQEYRQHMQAETGLEEAAIQAVRGLDAPDMDTRIAAVRTLRRLERKGVSLPAVGPALPSYLHVHTDRSYPGVPGAFSPAHMVWAAHQQGALVVYLVDHEALGHIKEGVRADRIVNEGAEKPLQAVFGVEFRTQVDSGQAALRDALARGVGGGNGGAWVVGMGVPVGEDGRAPEGLAQLVREFQQAKLRRAEVQVRRLNEGLGLALSLEDLLAPHGNITERALAYAASKAEGMPADLTPDEIRRRYINPVSYGSDFGFPPYEELVRRLSELGMIPAFTMQVPVPDLKGLLPELRRMGIEALDLSGIESRHPNAEADIAAAIDLGAENGMPVVGGADYRGEGAVGWSEPAGWMEAPTLQRSLLAVRAWAAAAGDPALAPLVREASGLLARPAEPVQINDAGTRATVYPHLTVPMAFLHWLADGRQADPLQVEARLTDQWVDEAASRAGVAGGREGLSSVGTEFRPARMELAEKIQRLPQFSTAEPPSPAREDWLDPYASSGLEEAQKALAEFARLDRFWSVEEVPNAVVRAVVLDATDDERVRHVAQALAIMLSRDEGQLDLMDFRLVLPAELVDRAVFELKEAYPQAEKAEAAAKILRDRIVPYNVVPYAATWLQATRERAIQHARSQLANRFGYLSPDQMDAAGALMPVVSRLTEDLLGELYGHFGLSGLMMTDQAVRGLKALIEAA